MRQLLKGSRNYTTGIVPTGTGTILLVEDEAPLRVLAAESLKRLGYSILQAGNGLEALALADHEMVEKLKQKRTGFAVIFMSGYTEVAALENANIGSDSMLLNKPFSTETLAYKITAALGKTCEIGGKAMAAGGSV